MKTSAVIGIILAAVLLAAAAFLLYAVRNLNGYRKNDAGIRKSGASEKQAKLPNGRTIHYGETENERPPLLLIHGQMVCWKDYAPLLPELARKWHVYAVDVYGHGQSSHDENLYYIDVNGEDLLWFIRHVIGEKTVVAGHSNGALTAAYLAAHGDDCVSGVLLEDPPVFSTEGAEWTQSFAYLDTYKPLHDYGVSPKNECWEAYYLRHCCWGQLFMKKSMDGIANYAQRYRERHPGEEVRLFFMPPSAITAFHYIKEYDFRYGEHFYDQSWNHGIRQQDLLTAVKVPCVYLHAREKRAPNGLFLCAASKAQAERAVKMMGENCRWLEAKTSDHAIHHVHRKMYLQALDTLWQDVQNDGKAKK